MKYKLVILHGWMHNSKVWEFVKSKLETINNIESVYIPDLPGFGKTPELHENATVKEYAEWAVREIQRSKIKDQNLGHLALEDSYIILGHSFGGRIGAEIASTNPTWLKYVILYGAPCIYRPSLKLRIRIKLNSLFGKLLPKTMRLKVLKDITKGEDLNSVAGTSMEQTFRNVITYDQTEMLKQIKIPVTLLVGDRDPEVRADMVQEMSKLIPNCTTMVLPNLGHNIHLENPNLFYGTIKKIVQNL